MSIPNIRNALESALAAIAPALDIVHENQAYEPTAGRPYQECYLLVATPSNPTMGDGYHQELGIFQINLQFPPDVGTLDCAQRAEIIRAAFKRGATFIDDGQVVLISRTPEIGAGAIEEGRWKQIIRIRWTADVYA
jgi:hypothetical protein